MPANNKPMRLSRQIEIFKVLESNLHKLENGAFEYLNGYSDESIAIRFDVHPTAISRLRKQLFGNLQRGGAATVARANRRRGISNTARVDSIDDRLSALEAQFAAAFGLRVAPPEAVAYGTAHTMQKPLSVPVRSVNMQPVS